MNGEGKCMMNYIKIGDLQVDAQLADFINKEALVGISITEQQFWSRFQSLIERFTPLNDQLLKERERLQKALNEWHQQNKQFTQQSYETFLKDIGYLKRDVEAFTIQTDFVDREVARMAGPQLVVPANNARYALNAANARWGSLYDALYGTDIIPETEGLEKGVSYNERRGEEVVRYAKTFLTEIFPLKKGTHEEVKKYSIQYGQLICQLEEGWTTLQDDEQCVGFTGTPEEPTAILLQHHELHVEIQIDRQHPIGKLDCAGVKDLLVESALSTILDCEDSVATVDGEDKVELYRNVLQIMQGTLTATFNKNGKQMIRTLNGDRTYKSLEGSTFTLKGRSLLFIRNVGHLMTNPAVLTANGREIYEGILDGVVTTLLALHNHQRGIRFKNSTYNSIYIVKPKMHGPEEAAFANALFNAIEDIFELERYTLKIGLMDEERRTSLNLRASIYEVRNRIAFINTGFLDRTGDEIHTSQEAGVMIRKDEMKQSTWLHAYEQSNVQTGLQCGLSGVAQIGKGMWAMPDQMAQMVKEKVNHPRSGANTAWVPSPTAATLHALHYFKVDVFDVQHSIMEVFPNRDKMLQLPIAQHSNWSTEEIQEELDNNVQSILGYVTRWIDQGIGCSKVPNIHHIGLMEDRATLRISSQHIANWLKHKIITPKQVTDSLQRMAVIVDEQNAGDPYYRRMAPKYEDSVAFQTATELIFEGVVQPNGYTEPILHKRRLQVKQQMKSKSPIEYA